LRLVKTFAGWLALILSAVILFVGVFAAVTIWRLSQEPVSLHRITPYIVDHLNKSMGENKLSVGDLVLRWRGWAERFDVGLRDVIIIGANDGGLLPIPAADVVFSTKALFEGVLAFREMNLIGPRIRLVRSTDGEIDIGYVAEDIDFADQGRAGDEKLRGPSVTIDLPSVKGADNGDDVPIATDANEQGEPGDVQTDQSQTSDAGQGAQVGGVEQSGRSEERRVGKGWRWRRAREQ